MVVFITNIPVPYREQVHQFVSSHLQSQYNVIYCAKLEPNRNWKFAYGNYGKYFLKDRSRGYIHNNPSVIGVLRKLRPDVVVTTGFNPTMLYGFLWAVFNRKTHIVFTDGTLKSEEGYSFVHVVIRKLVFAWSKAFVGASEGGRKLFQRYKVRAQNIFISCLCIDNKRFRQLPFNDKNYDLLFSGQLIERKMPLFFVDVARKLKEKRGSCKVLVLGKGPLEDDMRELMDQYKIEYTYGGFVQQEALPGHYASAKLFLFPTLQDPWGVVANEAMAAGLPVITCHHAGVANELVLDSFNGFVLPLDVEAWAEAANTLLEDRNLYETFSTNALRKVQEFNFESAAEGIVAAVRHSLAAKPARLHTKRNTVSTR